MAIRKEKDEVGQCKFIRDAKGRFAAKPIRPLPVNLKPVIEKWSVESKEEIDEPMFQKFKRIQGKMNPKKDCKDLFEEAHRYLVACGGMISKVLDKNLNKPFGFLVRIPGSTNPNVVFMRFIKYNPNNSNTYFQKLNAIVSTLICGERWLEKRAKHGYALDDIPFEVYYNSTRSFLVVSDDGITSVVPNTYIHYVQGRWMNEVEQEGYTIDDDMIEYFTRFEQKAHDYYKNNEKNKYFIALPFT